MIIYVFLHYRLFVLIWWSLSSSSSFNNPSTLSLQTLCSSLSRHHIVSRLWVLSHVHLVLLLSRICPDLYTQKSDAIFSEQKRKIWIQMKLLHDFRISSSSQIPRNQSDFKQLRLNSACQSLPAKELKHCIIMVFSWLSCFHNQRKP